MPGVVWLPPRPVPLKLSPVASKAISSNTIVPLTVQSHQPLRLALQKRNFRRQILLTRTQLQEPHFSTQPIHAAEEHLHAHLVAQCDSCPQDSDADGEHASADDDAQDDVSECPSSPTLCEDDGTESQLSDADSPFGEEECTESDETETEEAENLDARDSDDEAEDSIPGPFIRMYKLYDTTVGETVAVRDIRGGKSVRGRAMCMKIFPKAALRDDQAEKLVMQELKVHQIMNERAGEAWLPFVMRLECALLDVERLYFVMDLMQRDLLDMIKSPDYCKLRTRMKKRWVGQIAVGIAAIHDVGVVHLDLKPENLLLDFNFNIRIADFGGSYIHSERSIKPLEELRTDKFWGTPHYMAPESFKRDYKNRYKFTSAADYWALGCIVFELEINPSLPLFVCDEELEEFIHYKPSDNDGKSYFASANLSRRAESLISGLLRISPYLRYTKEDVAKHEYFHYENGVSLLDGLLADGLALSNNGRFNYVEAPILWARKDESDIYSPVAYKAGDDVPASSLHRFGWINPYGIYGSKNRQFIQDGGR